MSSNATLALRSLVTKLGRVAPVLTGRSALETTSAALPVIVVRSLGDSAGTDQVYDDPDSYTRRVGIEYLVDVSAISAYHETLDDALQAMRAVIIPETNGTWLGGYAVMLRQTGAFFVHPADNGGVAILQITLEFDYYA